VKAGALLFIFMLGGCASTFPYRITNNECGCERYSTRDKQFEVSYIVSAKYTVKDGISSQINIELQNTTHDTIDLSQMYVKITSRNIPYRYNDKFLPIEVPFVLPESRQTLNLVGESLVSDNHDPWLKIAGEELVVTLKGMRMGMHELQQQVVHLVPLNPKLGS
jgi:hypothetical protein